MISPRVILIFIIFSGVQISSGRPSRLYIWDVGQGQWVTFAQTHSCTHFDMGGEYAPKKYIKKLCQNKFNYLYLSHADTDHIKFIYWSKKNLTSLCLMDLPREILSPKKKWLLMSVPKCSDNLTSTLKNSALEKSVAEFPLPEHLKKPNDLSRVYILKRPFGDVLIPGDSTAKAEQYWRKSADLSHVKILLLGHHGSRTSTSPQLLSSLTRAKVAICSARKKRYGHPHQIVIDRLQKYTLPLLRTEQWGSFSIEM